MWRIDEREVRGMALVCTWSMSTAAVFVSSDTKAPSENEDVSCQELDVVFGDHRRTPHTYVVSVPKSHVINWQNTWPTTHSTWTRNLSRALDRVVGQAQPRTSVDKVEHGGR
jgi:hypothetical protein